MCRTADMCFIKSKEVQKIALNPQFEGFISTLQQAQQMDLFVNLVNAISSGALPTSNLAWKSSLLGVLGPCVSLQLALDLIQNSVNSLQFCRCFLAIHA